MKQMNGFRRELEEHILPFWMEKMVDHEHGGFYGALDGYNKLHSTAHKGAVMHMRVLWTFSAAYRVLGHAAYRDMADSAFDYIQQYFVDREFGGVFWELDYLGSPVQTKKQTYAQGFALYAFTEYYRATGRQDALEMAITLFHVIERCRDSENGGYWEAFTVDWQPLEDMRLSDKDQNDAKTMNTHLHILEPYTNLLRIWPDQRVLAAQRDLILVFLERICDAETGHLRLFFTKDWGINSATVSYGHDIEAAWLLLEAVAEVKDPALKRRVEEQVLQIAAAAKEGVLEDGSMAYERQGAELDRERHWWVQAETVVGYMYVYRLNKDMGFRNMAARNWQYIQEQLVDNEQGEWYWSRLPDGSINTRDDKAGFWKCPYHNGRMCLEMIEHFGL